MLILKKSGLGLMMFFIFSISICFANEDLTDLHESTAQACSYWIKPAIGTWYDYDGNVAMNITANGIDNCPFIKGFGFAGGYPRGGIFQVEDTTGYRDIRLDMEGRQNTNQQILIVDRKKVLYRYKKPKHYESVGGIYLGMSMKDVSALYGEPSKKSVYEAKYGPNSYTWTYYKEGIAVVFDADSAVNIYLLRYSKHHFDQSKLNYDSNYKTYYEKYKLSRWPTWHNGAHKIADGEYLFFNENSIALSIFDN